MDIRPLRDPSRAYRPGELTQGMTPIGVIATVTATAISTQRKEQAESNTAPNLSLAL
jgi:hypothetical protein